MNCALSMDTYWTDTCSGAAYSQSCKAGSPAIQELRELWAAQTYCKTLTPRRSQEIYAMLWEEGRESC